MSLAEILKTIETVIDAVFASGLIKDHKTAKEVLNAHAALEQKAAAEITATGGLTTVSDPVQ